MAFSNIQNGKFFRGQNTFRREIFTDTYTEYKHNKVIRNRKTI